MPDGVEGSRKDPEVAEGNRREPKEDGGNRREPEEDGSRFKPTLLVLQHRWLASSSLQGSASQRSSREAPEMAFSQ